MSLDKKHQQAEEGITVVNWDELRSIIKKIQIEEEEGLMSTQLLVERKKPKKVNHKFSVMWDELPLEYKVNRIIEYVDRFAEENELTEYTARKLKKLLVVAAKNRNLEVDYDSVKGCIVNVHKLYYKEEEGYYLGTYLNEQGSFISRVSKVSFFGNGGGNSNMISIITEDGGGGGGVATKSEGVLPVVKEKGGIVGGKANKQGGNTKTTKVEVDKPKIVNETKKVEVAMKKVVDTTKKVDVETKKADDETKKADVETKKVVGHTTKIADETKKVDVETKKVVGATKKVVGATKKFVDATKKADDETKKPVDETKKAVDETKKAVDETKKAVDETKKPVDETKKAVDETKKTDVATKNVDGKMTKAVISTTIPKKLAKRETKENAVSSVVEKQSLEKKMISIQLKK